MILNLIAGQSYLIGFPSGSLTEKMETGVMLRWL
jgi:hypothetical protein